MGYHVHKITPMMRKCGNAIMHDHYKISLVIYLIELLTSHKGKCHRAGLIMS